MTKQHGLNYCFSAKLEMGDVTLERDMGGVEQDLQSLKKLLEGSS